MSRALSRAVLAVAVVALVVAAGARAAGLWINLSGSMPIGVYRTVGGPIVRGSIVVVCLPESVAVFARGRGYLGRGTCPGGVEPIGKPVAALAGDSVVVRDKGVWINGREVVGSVPLVADRRGRPLVRYHHAPAVIGAGEVFLLSTRDRRSFDGRYFGPLTTTNIRALVATPALGVR